MEGGEDRDSARFRLAGWTVEPARLLLVHESNGERRLSPRAMSVLVALAGARGEVVRKYDLIHAVWAEADVSDGMLSQTILELRNALGDDARNPRVIETIRRVGFRLIPRVEPAPATPAAGGEAAVGHPVSRWGVGAAALVAVLGLVVWLSLRPAPAPTPADGGKPRVMVLPFEDLSPGGDYGYFASGIADEIALHLASSAELRIVANRAVAALAARGVAPDAMADELSADLVLSGTVQRREETIRLVVRLTDGARGEELWITRFDRPVGDVFAVQDEAARSIAAIVLRGETLPQRVTPTENLSAYDIYLQGRASQRQLTAPSNAEAIRLFRHALAIDPAFTLARARLAESLAIQGYIFQAGEEPLHAARREAELALLADPTLADGMYAKALALAGLGRFAEASEQAIAAAERMPSNADALFLAASLAEARGDLVSAVRDYSLALRINPTLPRTVALGRLHLVLGDPDTGWQIAERGHLLAPGYPTLYLAFVTALHGDPARAGRLCEQAVGMKLPRARNLCGFVALVGGRPDDARALLEADWASDPRAQTGPFTFAASATHLALLSDDPDAADLLLRESEAITLAAIAGGNDHWSLRYNMAVVAVLRNDTVTALDWLEAAHAEGFRDLRLLEVDPGVAALRGTPGFQEFSARLRGELSEAAIAVRDAS